MPQDLIIGAKTGGSSNLLRINNASRRFSFRDIDGSWKEAAFTDYVVFERPEAEDNLFLSLELSINADYSSLTTINSQTDQTGFIYYDGSAWVAFPAAGLPADKQGALVAFNFASKMAELGSQLFFRFWWAGTSTTTEKKASIFPAINMAATGSGSVSVEEATDTKAGIARAATQSEVNAGTAGFIFVTPTTLAAKTFAASQISGLAAVATSGDYEDLQNKYELPAASASVRGGVRIGSNINLTDTDVISVAAASTSTAGVVALASNAEVTAGTVNNKAVTPAGMKVELDKKANASDLAAVATSGSYNDLTDKPEIPEVNAASTTQAGIVRLATTAEAAGNLGTIALTPAGLNAVLQGYYTSSEIDSKISTVLKYKGVKASEAELPASGSEIGDIWLVSADSSEYVWNGTKWEKFGPTISLDGYLTEEAAAQTYVAKTQLATASQAGIVQIGQNIAVNAGVISVAAASTSTAGVIALASAAEVTAGTVNNKAVTPATLKTELDKKVNSSSLAAVATSGDYSDLINGYELPAATSTIIGGVKPGGNLSVTGDGTLNFTGLTVQNASGNVLSSEIKVFKAGSGTTFTVADGVATIGLDSSATGGLTAVNHDETLTGQGTSADPLAVNKVTSINKAADASDTAIPTEKATATALEEQQIKKIMLQRPVSDKTLFPKIIASASADFSSPITFDPKAVAADRNYCEVFNGTGWVAFPADGLGTPYDEKELSISVEKFASLSWPFYYKFCWVDSEGSESDYKSAQFPASLSFPPAISGVVKSVNGQTPDETGNVTIEIADESRLLPTGGKNGDILGYQEGMDQGNGDNVRLLLQNALTDSAKGNASPVAVTTQGVTLTGDSDLLFDGNDSHITAVLATDEIFTADKEWTIDFWMNPTANSSEWNYVLTENRGDWGTYSLGLTWNKSKAVLEQDTGGYVAFKIKSPNWPNDSVACAADTWHFVAVEKQKTASGWNLNYYLNGAIWLQVAFTGDFVPFNSSNPFWFGGKTTDGGRWFKGKANKIRVTAGARYGGKAFAVPNRLTDYAAPAGQPVWTEGIDRSRLLPENPADGDIPCYSNEPPKGVNYNDANTVLLLQGSSNNIAKGTKLPVLAVGSPAVQDDGSLLFAANDQIKTTSAAEVKRVFGGEFTVDAYIKPTQFDNTSRQDTNFFNLNGPSTYRLYVSNFEDSGNTVKDKWGLWAYAGQREITLGNNEWHHAAVDVYLVNGTRKYTFYYDGVPVLTGNWYSDGLAGANEEADAVITFFGASDNQNFTNGYVKSLRVSDIARYKGVSFEPPTDGKYLNLPAGYWNKFNKSELVPSNSKQLLPADAANNAMVIHRNVPEDAAPSGLTSFTSDPNWEVTQSGSYAGREGWQAFDNDQGTAWCTHEAKVGDWLCWEYKGTAQKVLLRRYSIAKASGNADHPTGWKIQGSNDGVIWTDLDEQTGQSFPNNDAKEYTIPNNRTPYKFHRFYLLSWVTANFIGTFKAWSWINSVEECDIWCTIDISEVGGTSENEIALIRPVSDSALFPVVEASSDVGFTSVQTIDTLNVAADRDKVKAFNGSAFANFPANGLGTPYDEQSVIIDVSAFIAAFGDSFYVRYKWTTADGAESDYKAIKFPVTAAQTPVASSGGSGGGDVTYQTFAIPAQDSWTADSADATRKYVSVASGRCSCLVYDENGIEVGIEVRYVSSANETRLVIPADLAEGTITTSWTCRYAKISEN